VDETIVANHHILLNGDRRCGGVAKADDVLTCVTKLNDNRSKTMDYGTSAHDLLDHKYIYTCSRLQTFY